jgi:hypothetical protein
MKSTSHHLRTLKRLLKSARDMVHDCHSIAHDTGDTDQAERLKEVSRCIADEVDHVDLRIVEAERPAGGEQS